MRLNMKLHINHVAKIEGHAGFVTEILKGDVRKAKIITQEGARLIEGIVIGRHFSQAPIITSRICGLCPVVHNLASIKAIESAFGIKPSEQTVDLRNLMIQAQIIYSHVLHFYFLTLPDFFDIENDITLVKKYPKETKMIFDIREWAIEIMKAVGGRMVHPIASEIGGFKVLPKKESLQRILDQYDDIIKKSEKIASFFSSLKIPKFKRETENLAIKKNGEYAFYEGAIVSSKGWSAEPKDFEKNIEELQIPYYMSKRVVHEYSSYMVGAISRINLNHKSLNPKAKKAMRTLKLKPPLYNTFANILCQVVENVHAVEQSQKIIVNLLKNGLAESNVSYKPAAGYGASAIEAPRGTLYHALRLDENGIITDYNIMTPTVQFLANLEDDINAYIPDLKNLSEEKRTIKIRSLIRAYDPCITCATH